MVINKILKQLTPGRVKKEIEAIQEVKLPPELQKWVREYEKVGERSEFLWKWAYKVSHVITFTNIPRKYYSRLVKTKFLMIMFIVLLDDVADKTKNQKLLDKTLKIPFEEKNIKITQLNKKEKEYLKFTQKVWHFIEKSLKENPEYKKFKKIIDYDTKQILNGINYAYLVNKNLYLTNEAEFQIYLSHNTPAIIGYMMDLTCLPKFNIKNLGFMRKIMFYIQIMARISNWLATWKREIKENDFASGIFCHLIENKLIEIKNLHKVNEKEIIKKIEKLNVEKYFLEKWEEYYKKIEECFKKNKYIHSRKIFKLAKELTTLHLISRGFI